MYLVAGFTKNIRMITFISFEGFQHLNPMVLSLIVNSALGQNIP
jgi:hypothetical protein